MRYRSRWRTGSFRSKCDWRCERCSCRIAEEVLAVSVSLEGGVSLWFFLLLDFARFEAVTSRFVKRRIVGLTTRNSVRFCRSAGIASRALGISRVSRSVFRRRSDFRLTSAAVRGTVGEWIWGIVQVASTLSGG
jgi:hypothetical protein